VWAAHWWAMAAGADRSRGGQVREMAALTVERRRQRSRRYRRWSRWQPVKRAGGVTVWAGSGSVRIGGGAAGRLQWRLA
jgi:hypothetical protein